MRNWRDFRDNLRARFGNKSHDYRIWSQILARRQGNQERVDDYIGDVKRMANTMSKKPDAEQLIQYVKEGLLPDIQKAVAAMLFMHIEELEDACCRAELTVGERGRSNNKHRAATGRYDKRYEAHEAVRRHSNSRHDRSQGYEANEAVHRYPNSRRRASSESSASSASSEPETESVCEARVDDKRRDKRERARPLDKRKGGKQDSPEVDKRLVCYNCGKIGHFFNDCRKPQDRKFCYRCGKVDVTTNDERGCTWPKNGQASSN